jgi:hypothetical protein
VLKYCTFTSRRRSKIFHRRLSSVEVLRNLTGVL